LAKSILFIKVRGGGFDCGTAVGSMCSSSGGGFTGGGRAGGGVITRPDHSPIDLGGGRGPTSRPGSKVDDLVKELNSLIGLEGVKAGINALRDAVEFDMWRKRFLGDEWSLLGQSFHMRFLGNPGTGKTVVARIVGKILVELEVVKKPKRSKKDELVFKEVSRADLVAGYVGQTAPKVMQAVKSAFGGVLFIDEAYSLVQDEKDSFGREAVDTLIKEIEDNRDKVIVIFAGYSNEMETFFEANPGFQSRVPFRFEFADYNCQELGGIGELQLKQQSIEPTATAKEWMNDVIMSKTGCCTEEELTSGTCAGATRDNGNGRAVRNILEGALRSMSVRAVAESQEKWGGGSNKRLVTELQEVDVAAVGGQLIAEAVRGTCKAANEAVPELERLCTGGRILSVSSFKDLLQKSREDCSGATAMLEGLRSTTSVVDNAMDIKISDPKIKKVFEELDEYIGLLTVKRTMRELFTTVQFADLRKQQNFDPLKSQSFHMRFLGNPGTGKTVVARVVGKLLVGLGAIENPNKFFGKGSEPIFNEVSRSDLVAEYVGQTANKTQHWIKESLGGVFFLDEAYALVQGDKDTFGQEAVDTLIKEMEDKRKSVIVICAGYANEMEEFFQSNPGFKSRVPFTFFFEDYTCNELSQIGLMQLEKKQLKIPRDLTSYEQSIRFSTGCCDRLEDCEESKDKGNGRAVRNAVEASIRAMARRLADDKGQPDKTKYSTMLDEDFRATTATMIESRLTVPCGSNGELQKITGSVMRAEVGVLENLPGEQAELVARVQRLAEETRLVESMAGLDHASVELGNVCRGRFEMMTRSIHNKLQQVCAAGDQGILNVVQASLQAESDPKIVQMYANILAGIVRDQAFMREILRAAWKEEDLDAEDVPELEQSCDERMEDLRRNKFQVPFDFLTFR
jgi:SpoVK/Ycf46/Vps4 family AAA+-type ATPase